MFENVNITLWMFDIYFKNKISIEKCLISKNVYHFDMKILIQNLWSDGHLQNMAMYLYE